MPNIPQVFTIGLTAVVLLANQRYGWVSDQATNCMQGMG
jgi:hypothetical protein